MSIYNRDRGLSGLNPLAYIGVEPTTPPQLLQELRAPTVNDYVGYPIGTLWLEKGTENIWVLTDKTNQVSTWTIMLGAGLQFSTDDGNHAHPLAGTLNVMGGPNIDTTAVPNFGQNVIVGLQDNLVIPGNVQIGSLAADGVMTTDHTGLIQTSNGANGQVLIGGGVAPAWANLTSGDASITITNGVNTIDLIAVGGGGAGFAGLLGDNAVLATPDILHQIQLVGGEGLTTVGAPGIMTINMDQSALNGQLLIGGGAGVPTVWNRLVSGGASVLITYPAPNTINLEAVGGGGGGFGGLKDDANAIAAPDGASTVKVAGGTLLDTLTSLNTVTVGLEYTNNNNLDPDGSFTHDGNVIISSHNSPPIWAKLTAGPFITITPNVNQLTISGHAGAGSGVNVFDCISGTAIPNPLAPNQIFVEGDADPLSGGYNNITTIARNFGGGIHDCIEIVLQPRIYLPDTNVGGSTGVVYLGGTPPQRFIHRYGTYNTFYGATSGNFTLTTASAQRNTGIGYNSLNDITTGASNTAVGSTALDTCTTGNYNTAVGTAALGAITGHSNHTAVGYHAATALTTGDETTAIGYNALAVCTTGDNNTAIGTSALASLTTSDYNVAVGRNAGFLLATGTANTIVGSSALDAGTSASYNTVIGYSSMGGGITTGNGYNTAIGYRSAYALTSGVSNVAVGRDTLFACTTGDTNTAVGNLALSALTLGFENTAIGNGAGSIYTTERGNILLNNPGAVGDITTTRIGTAAQTACYLGGAYNKTVGVTRHPLYIDSTGKIGNPVAGAGDILLSAHLNADVVNATGDATKYYLGDTAGQVGAWMHADTNHGGGTFLQGGLGVPASYRFPVSGSYLITFTTKMNGLRAPIVIPPPPPPVFLNRDPIVMEVSGSSLIEYSYFPSLKFDGISPYQSASFTAVTYRVAGDFLKWYIQIDYRPGESVGGGWPLTYNQQSKTIGVVNGDRFTYVSISLLEAY